MLAQNLEEYMCVRVLATAYRRPIFSKKARDQTVFQHTRSLSVGLALLLDLYSVLLVHIVYTCALDDSAEESLFRSTSLVQRTAALTVLIY